MDHTRAGIGTTVFTSTDLRHVGLGAIHFYQDPSRFQVWGMPIADTRHLYTYMIRAGLAHGPYPIIDIGGR